MVYYFALSCHILDFDEILWLSKTAASYKMVWDFSGYFYGDSKKLPVVYKFLSDEDII